jgi:hypothetical protein
MVYAADVNFLRIHIDAINKHTGILIDALK